METLFNWAAPIATTIAAVMVAANAGSRITGYGFIVFCIGSIAWMGVGWLNGQANLLIQNGILLAINMLGIWRWLGLRARYEKGAEAEPKRERALVPTSKICGAAVRDEAGNTLGSIVELMLDDGDGQIGYAVLSYGGMVGVGEKLFAVPFDRLRHIDEGFALKVRPDALERASGFDKDAWPTAPDPLFS